MLWLRFICATLRKNEWRPNSCSTNVGLTIVFNVINEDILLRTCRKYIGNHTTEYMHRAIIIYAMKTQWSFHVGDREFYREQMLHNKSVGEFSSVPFQC